MLRRIFMEKFSVKKIIGEVLGTLALVLVGAGSAALTGDLLITALAFGLSVVVLVAIGGGQYNPAVSLAAAIDKRIGWVEMLINVVAQIVGAVLAALLIWLFLGSNTNLGANGFGVLVVAHDGDKTIGMLLALVVEVILTFFFVLTILRATREDEEGKVHALAPVVIGLALVVLIGLGFGLTGGSLNPARSLGPALLQGGVALEMVWVYLVGPAVGGALAALVHKVL